MDTLNVMVMGGRTKGFHDFAEMAPIYEAFLAAAGFKVKITEDRDDFLAERIKDFDVIVDYTTGEELSPTQAGGLIGHIVSGHGFVGVHSAADSFKNSQAYMRMVGGVFLTHPPTIPHTFKVTQPDHPCMAGVEEEFTMAEELYLMDYLTGFDTLMVTEFNSFRLPMAWVKPYGFGRIFYTALGHGAPQHNNPNFQKMVVNAIRWSSQAKDVRAKCKEIGGW
ncbi:MAG: ThuA domain-containing protein [Planctomycetaceae bacterium]|nr:ThuA domain-containing protein [Planctomycetaceae bacterium]